MKTPLITLDKLTKTYHDVRPGIRAFEDISFSAAPGEFICIIGPSGCGKSTLLRVIAGLIKPDAGQVVLNRNKLSMIFQNSAIFPWLTVAENVGFGLEMAGLGDRAINQRIKRHIADMGLAGSENQHPRELSGGMKQRVGIARALAMEPDILLMDEPFSALDALTAKQLRADVLGIWEQSRMSVIMVTHLVEEAVELADRIVVLSPRPGRVVEVMPIRMPRPRDRRSQQFYNYVDKLEEILTVQSKSS